MYTRGQTTLNDSGKRYVVTNATATPTSLGRKPTDTLPYHHRWWLGMGLRYVNQEIFVTVRGFREATLDLSVFSASTGQLQETDARFLAEQIKTALTLPNVRDLMPTRVSPFDLTDIVHTWKLAADALSRPRNFTDSLLRAAARGQHGVRLHRDRDRHHHWSHTGRRGLCRQLQHYRTHRRRVTPIRQHKAPSATVWFERRQEWPFPMLLTSIVLSNLGITEGSLRHPVDRFSLSVVD